MANAISFKPAPIDPRQELQRRLAEAPQKHAEALLVGYDVLEEAHKQGLLDALHGAIGARDTIAGLVAKYAADPVSVNALRNLIALGAVLGSLDPGPLGKLSKSMVNAVETHQQEEKPPSLWQLFKRVRTPEARRGMSLMTHLLSALGASSK